MSRDRIASPLHTLQISATTYTLERAPASPGAVGNEAESKGPPSMEDAFGFRRR